MSFRQTKSIFSDLSHAGDILEAFHCYWKVIEAEPSVVSEHKCVS